MNTKFQIGQEVFFMIENTPKKDKIVGISQHKGKINNLYSHCAKDIPCNEVDTEYYFGASYQPINESKIFYSKDEMQEVLFKSIL